MTEGSRKEGAFDYRKSFIKLCFSKSPFYFVLLVGVHFCSMIFLILSKDNVSS